MIISGHFEQIFSEDCYLSNPKISESKLIICVRNVGIISGHPLFSDSVRVAIQYFPSAHFIFDGVESSIRELYEYEFSPKVAAFKPKRTIQDGPFPRVGGKTDEFRFNGVLDYPQAWTDWTVFAMTFSLEIPEVASTFTS